VLLMPPRPLSISLTPPEPQPIHDALAQASPDACCADCSDGCCAADTGRERVGEAWLGQARRARRLAWASLAWMTAEGVIGLIAGIAAGSIALTGWALGSAIEGLASIIVIWRFTGSRTLSETAERRAGRAVAISFWLLAPWITAEAIRDLVTGHQATTSILGIALTASSLVIMPALGVAKQRLGRQLSSGATTGEGTQNLMCAAQAAAVLVGLAITAMWPSATAIDPAIALLIAAWSIWEGRQSWLGADCC
jgi:divalent metal cation (Fe/Co/Zn/Cd) transporter